MKNDLKQGNKRDTMHVHYPEETYSEVYGKFIDKEVRECLKKLKRKTEAGINAIQTLHLRKVPQSLRIIGGDGEFLKN